MGSLLRNLHQYSEGEGEEAEGLRGRPGRQQGNRGAQGRCGGLGHQVRLPRHLSILLRASFVLLERIMRVCRTLGIASSACHRHVGKEPTSVTACLGFRALKLPLLTLAPAPSLRRYLELGCA